jgi:hypothetical protein
VLGNEKKISKTQGIPTGWRSAAAVNGIVNIFTENDHFYLEIKRVSCFLTSDLVKQTKNISINPT